MSGEMQVRGTMGAPPWEAALRAAASLLVIFGATSDLTKRALWFRTRSVRGTRRFILSGGLALASLLWLSAPAHAHRLEADYRVLPGQQVQIESWFDLTGDSPKGARVQVFRGDGQLLTEGTVDAKGLFAFHYERIEPLRVVISAGEGHRKELTIPEAALTQTPTAGAMDAGPFADRSARVSVRDVLAGLGFLLGLAAFVLSLRNARKLRGLKR